MGRRALSLIAFGLVGIGLVAGCSGTPEFPPEPGASSSLPRTPYAFDIYLGDRIDLINYAKRKEVAECMAAVGYPQIKDAGVQRYDTEATRLVLDVGRALGYTSQADARSRGFGKFARAEPAPIVSFDANFDQALKVCEDKAAETLGTGQEGFVQQYVALGNVLNLEFGSLWARPRFQADFAVLADCMARSGRALLDRDAFIKNDMARAFGLTLGKLDDFPGSNWEPVRVPGTVAVGPAIPARRYIPTADEAELAVAWFECDQESGRVEKFLADAREQAETILAKYEDQFTELNPQIEALAEKAAALVR